MLITITKVYLTVEELKDHLNKKLNLKGKDSISTFTISHWLKDIELLKLYYINIKNKNGKAHKFNLEVVKIFEKVAYLSKIKKCNKNSINFIFQLDKKHDFQINTLVNMLRKDNKTWKFGNFKLIEYVD